MKTITFVFLISWLVSGAFAQSKPPTSQSAGSLKGVVRRDDNSAPIPKVIISIKRKRFKQQITSDAQGVVESQLPAGSYEITFKHPKFHYYRAKNIVVHPAETTTFEVKLLRANVPQIIE